MVERLTIAYKIRQLYQFSCLMSVFFSKKKFYKQLSNLPMHFVCRHQIQKIVHIIENRQNSEINDRAFNIYEKLIRNLTSPFLLYMSSSFLPHTLHNFPLSVCSSSQVICRFFFNSLTPPSLLRAYSNQVQAHPLCFVRQFCLPSFHQSQLLLPLSSSQQSTRRIVVINYIYFFFFPVSVYYLSTDLLTTRSIQNRF